MLFSKKSFQLIFLLLFAVAITFSACRSSEVSKKQIEELEKVDNQDQKQYEKEYKAALKKHYKMQSENTKEMMKQRKKQQRKYNKNHERTLWDRIFRRKCKSNFNYGNG